MTAILGNFVDGGGAELDVDVLVGSHLCIQANSGAGKSGAIRKLLEETHGALQHIVLDVEDEFYTLREQYEYLIAGGENGDCAANVNNAEALATTILKAGFSAIVQINSLRQSAREMFIASFLQALTDAPKALWRPLLLVLDEAQFYAPQQGFAASSDAVINFMMLGRKRGFTGVLATPRSADLDKRATAPVNNWLIGRCGQPADRRAAASAVGFSEKSPEGLELRQLPSRTFWAFGPAISLEPRKLEVGQTSTTIVKAGQAMLPTPPAPAAMRKILEGLNAAAIEKETQAASTEMAKSDVDPKAIEKAEQRGYERGNSEGYLKGIAAGRRHITGVITELRGIVDASIAEAERLCDLAYSEASGYEPAAPTISETSAQSTRSTPSEPPQSTPRAKSDALNTDGSLTGCAPSLLTAFARGATSWEHAAMLACIIPGNGYFYKGKKALIDGGWVADGEPIALTAMAMRSIEPLEPMKIDQIVALWVHKLRSPGDQILRQLAGDPDRTFGSDVLAGMVGIKPGNGYWYKGLKAARDANLIEQDRGSIRLSEFLRRAPR